VCVGGGECACGGVTVCVCVCSHVRVCVTVCARQSSVCARACICVRVYLCVCFYSCNATLNFTTSREYGIY
jgi:hypothetical protein